MIKNLIRHEYMMRSEVLANMCNHIDNLNKENIIYHTNRNKFMSDLNGCVLKLNNSYNEIIHKHKKIDYKIESETMDHVEYYNYINFFNQNNYVKPYVEIGGEGEDEGEESETSPSVPIQLKFFGREPYDVDKDILTLMTKVGSSKISDIFRIVIGENYRDILDIDNSLDKLRKYTQDNKLSLELIELMKMMHNSMALFDILNSTFIPVEMYLKSGFARTSILVKKFKYDNRQYIGSEESSKFKYEVMLDNCYKLTIKTKYPNKTFVIIGYFNYDVVGTTVATSQICHNYIYYKKKLLMDYAKENAMINNSYKDVYLQNISLGEILCFKGDELIDKMLYDYDIYTKSCNIKFKVIIQEFLKADLAKKFNILRCLLLGPKNSIKHGAMLFGMTKDQNRDVKNNKSFVSDILFRNLSHSQQCRLRKSGQYIKHELDRIKKMSSDDIDLKQQCMMNNNMSDYIKKCALTKLEEMKSSNSEYSKNHTYVKTLVDFPWVPENYQDIFTTIGNNLEKCKEKLDKIKEHLNEKVYGHTECKTVICDLVGKWFSNPNSMGKAIGLCGPPGVGKTLIASGLGKVLGIPYQEIHLSGMDDGSVLSGHSFTYSGALPGLIVAKMVMAGEPRCILFFDELDKACAKHGINEIFNVLIHVTDPNTNDKFNDKFFQDVTFPLSKCVFVFSFNDESKIDPILRDRMEIIKVGAYSTNDKMLIVKNYLFQEILTGVGIEKGAITMTPPTIEHLINNYTIEAGVRSLKTKLEKIILKMNVDRIYGRGPFKNKSNFSVDNPIKITKNHVIKYLGKPKLSIDEIHETNQVGVINGLYATTVGSGGIIPILVYHARGNNNKFFLEMTGNQAKVMRESISFSWTIAKNCVKPNLINQFYKENSSGIHVHTPDGATPKDGPSAGGAFTTAFISRILGLKIKRDIALTGEIGIGGAITAIGGLECKLTGAKAAKVKFVLVCRKNIDDVKKIKESNSSLFNLINPRGDADVQKIIDACKKKNSNVGDFKVMVVDSIYDVIEYALVDDEYVNQTYEDGKYRACDKTMDCEKYMVKNENGFITAQIEKIDDVKINDEDDDGDDDDHLESNNNDIEEDDDEDSYKPDDDD